MKNVKITINSEDRIVVIPITYDESTDSGELNEIQIEPVPDKNEVISNDIVLNIANAIISLLKNN